MTWKLLKVTIAYGIIVVVADFIGLTFLLLNPNTMDIGMNHVFGYNYFFIFRILLVIYWPINFIVALFYLFRVRRQHIPEALEKAKLNLILTFCIIIPFAPLAVF